MTYESRIATSTLRTAKFTRSVAAHEEFGAVAVGVLAIL